jgi:hypothetical protein
MTLSKKMQAVKDAYTKKEPTQTKDEKLLQAQVVGILNTLQRMGKKLRGEGTSGVVFLFLHTDGDIMLEGSARAGWVTNLKPTAGTRAIVKKMALERGGE